MTEIRTNRPFTRDVSFVHPQYQTYFLSCPIPYYEARWSLIFIVLFMREDVVRIPMQLIMFYKKRKLTTPKFMWRPKTIHMLMKAAPNTKLCIVRALEKVLATELYREWNLKWVAGLKLFAITRDVCNNFRVIWLQLSDVMSLKLSIINQSSFVLNYGKKERTGHIICLQGDL
jgi:hypothetical protein